MSKVNNNDMEKCNKSHGKKSDKETHTPMLKIFKDMIQLEKNDPEKANLLKDKERNKKRKQYTASRSKSDVINRSCDSSSSDRHRVSQVIEHREYDVQCHGISKKPNVCKKGSKRSDSTESGISCALKRLATSEYTCIACLGILLAITIIVAFCLVFKSPTCAVKTHTTRASKTIFRGRDFGDAGFKEGLDDRTDWDDSKLGRYGDLSLTDFDDSSSRSLNGRSLNQYSELSRIIDVNKLNYGKSSERLKSFYKKLLQTDDQIKNLKKGMTDSTYSNMKAPDRKKRSVKHHSFHFNNNKRYNNMNKRNKRYSNYTAPTGFVIEKKKIMVRLPSGKKKVPKCSHAPKDSKSHETELKHPFYKHTQRLDELLDQFIDRNLPQIFGDLNLGSLFQTQKVEHTTRKITTTHRKSQTNVDIVTDNYKKSMSNNFFKVASSSKSAVEVILGVTTVIGPSKKEPTKSLLGRVPNIRKLMQVYEDDEENLGYEDLKEVLTDDVESHDDTEVKVDRNKRSYETDPNHLENTKTNLPGVQIPNWKGPLPLYPDELNTMIKGRTDNANKPITKDSSRSNVMFTDIEYVEDYLTDKYEKLANMAQAYSDYGVLDEKKETKNDNTKSDNTDNRSKFSLDLPKLQKNLIDRFQKGTTDNQQVYFNKRASEDCFCVPKFLKKHIKIVSTPKSGPPTPKSGPSTPKSGPILAPKTNFEYPQNKFKLEKSDAENQDIMKFKYDKGSLQKHVFEQSQKQLRLDRSVDIIYPNVSSDDEIKKRSMENIDTTAKTEEVFSLEVGMDEKLFSNDNGSIKIGCELHDNKKTNVLALATTPDKYSNTPRINNENPFKHRSLLSIEESDQEKVIGIDEDITMEDLTTEFIEESNGSNIISLPAKNNNDAVTDVDDNFELEISTHANTTNMNVLNISTKQCEPNIIDHVTVVNIIENLTHKTFTEAKNESTTNLDRDAQKRILNIVDLANSQNRTRKDGDGMDLSDFFRMISTWFSSLASASLDDNDDNSGTVNPIMKLKTSETPGDMTFLNINRSDIHYPSYDSDMIDNIGHRSRVLMSVDEVSNVTEGKKEIHADLSGEKDKQTADLQQTNSTEIPENLVLTTTNEERDTISDEDKNTIDNRTLVKRSIGDSGLVFWSDLYDDEYGIKVDPLEKELAGKNANRGKEFMKRSRNWFQGKVKSIADNIKGFRNEAGKSNANNENNRIPKFSNVFKRQAEMEKNHDTKEKVTNFAELTVKMRNIVKEAAKAVQQTRNMQVRESKDDSVANGIMQQLVRMMSDLVNFQVQQKTCVKLPADLQNFLEWITNPKQDRQSLRQVKLQDSHIDDTKTFEKDKDFDSTLMIQDKTECLETLHAIEDLLQQYDHMDDEDKSKMTGVRQYLENQLEFLNKQLSMMDEFNFSNIYSNQPPARFRRHLTTQKTPTLNKNNIRRRMKRRLRNFIRNFGKKHTKGTSSPYNAEVTEDGRSFDNNGLDNVQADNNKELIVKNLDRNLHTVQNNEIEDKVHKSNTKQDNIKSFQEEYALFIDKNDNSKESEKVLSRKDDLNNFYNNNDESEQTYNIYSKANDRQDSFNRDDNIERNDLVKRNLQDVYYRALYEAKKVTTVKNVDKSDSSL